MNKIFKKIISTFLILPLFLAMTFCCCLERDAHASMEHVSKGARCHQGLEKSHHHSEKNQHQHSDHECTCPKHLSFLSEQPFDITPDLSSFQPLVKSSSIVPTFQVVLLSSTSLYANGPPWQDHHEHSSVQLFIKNSNLRI